MPNFDLDFIELKPLRTIKFNKEKLSNEILKVYLDFDFISKHDLDKSDFGLIEKQIEENKIKIKLVDFYQKFWFYNKARFIQYELKPQ